MRHVFRSGNGRGVFAVVLLASLAVRLWIAWQPAATLVEKNLPDDAFYYFVLAHNTVQFGTVSLDGVNVTNGFHPLWWILLMPIFGRSTLGDVPIHLALSLASLLDVISVWAIGWVSARLTHREGLGALAALLYGLNPVAILQATNGLETSLAMTTLTLFWWSYLCWLDSPTKLRWNLTTAALGALMFLARSDSIFFLGFALVGIIGYWGIRKSWRRVTLTGGIIVLLVSPWFLWSRIAVGTWLQESGVAVPFAIRTRLVLERGNSISVFVHESLRQLVSPAFWLRGDGTGLPLVGGVVLWLIVLAGLVVRWRKSPSRSEMAALLPILASGAALVLVHAGIRWYPRPWYFVPSAAAFAVCAALASDAVLRQRRRLFLAVLTVLVYYGLAGYVFWYVGYYPWQRDMLRASTWLAENMPPSTKVGSFNAGIYAYYSGRRTVDLDGVVNHAAFAAVQDRAIIPYLQQNQISLLVDFDLAVRKEYAPFMGDGYPEVLQEVAVLGGYGNDQLGMLRAYHIKSSPETAK